MRETLVNLSEFKCIQCGHDFGKGPWTGEAILCPRCGSEKIETNPYLFGSCSAEGLTAEDYYAVALKP